VFRVPLEWSAGEERRTVMRHVLLVRLGLVLTVLGMVAALAQPVSAGKPEKVVIHEEFDEDLCGIPVHTTVDGFFILHIQDYVIQADDPTVEDDFWIGVVQTHFNVTYTNAAGDTVLQTERNTLQEDALVDNGDGTWTYTYSVSGAPLRLKAEKGTMLLDAGRISVSIVLYFGDLSTQADNFFVSEEITRISGPHPIAESDFALFCEFVTDTLG
jgi:hypothetical protein